MNGGVFALCLRSGDAFDGHSLSASVRRRVFFFLQSPDVAPKDTGPCSKVSKPPQNVRER